MFKIQVLNAVSDTGLKEFPDQLYAVSADIHQPDALLLRSKVLHDETIPDSVKAIGRAGAGVDNIPVAAMTQRGIPVFNTPGANANAVCELVLAGMLMASRNLCKAWDYVNKIDCSKEDLNKVIEQNKKQFAGFELMGKTLGLIGLGSIGVKVANVAISLGMKVLGYDPTITVNRAWELSANVKQAKSLEELLKQSDFVSVHVPLAPTTTNLLNHERIALMKTGAVLLNFARDGIVNEDALLNILQEKNRLHYVTDFPSLQLCQHPNVICLPHLGASTREAEENCAVMIVKQLRAFFEYGAISNSVNFPVVDVGPIHEGTRIAIVNRNVPNMVAQISSKLAEQGLNILSLVNQSRDEIAYTLIDVDKKTSPDILQKIATVQGVLQVRPVLCE